MTTRNNICLLAMCGAPAVDTPENRATAKRNSAVCVDGFSIYNSLKSLQARFYSADHATGYLEYDLYDRVRHKMCVRSSPPLLLCNGGTIRLGVLEVGYRYAGAGVPAVSL